MPLSKETLEPRLYLIATPIGNLGDITQRALETLRNVDIIACEDQRVSQKLLSHFGIKAKTLAYHDHNEGKQYPYIIDKIKNGASVALISDAGTPLIADPGYRLVAACHEQDIPVTALPGPCAMIMGLSMSGLPTNRFLFEGFLPPKSAARKARLDALSDIQASLIFYESPKRLIDCLKDMISCFGPRPAAVARELTKKFEQIKNAPLPDLLSFYEQNPPRGEIIIIISPPMETQTPGLAQLQAPLKRAVEALGHKEGAALMADLTGLPRKALYQKALEMKEAKDETKEAKGEG